MTCKCYTSQKVISAEVISTNDAKRRKIRPNEKFTIITDDIGRGDVKLYSGLGDNTDGAIHQKGITAIINKKADKVYVDNSIRQALIPYPYAVAGVIVEPIENNRKIINIKTIERR